MDFDKFQCPGCWNRVSALHRTTKLAMMGTLYLLISLAFGTVALAKTKVAVFFPTTVPVANIQKALEADPAYKNSEVTVYKKV